jgi:carbon-monoxide dehydrogenase medium subunit
VIAGGTDLIVQLRQRKAEVEALVDVTGLPGLDLIDLAGGEIEMGSLVTHAQAAGSELILNRAGPLAQGCAAVGSPQIRNIATVAGNLISGQPAADAAIPLLALEAQVTIASTAGERKIPLGEFFLGPGETALDSSREIMTRISFPGLRPLWGGAFMRLAKRKALTLPMLVCAVVVKVDEARKIIEKAAIAAGPVAPIPFRERELEEELKGAPATRETVEEAARRLSALCSPRDSLLRGSCDYRQEMIKVLVRRGLIKALAQAGCSLD